MRLREKHLALLQLLADGHTVARAAAELHYAEGTVRGWLKREILPALGASNKTHAVVLALVNGWIE